MAINWRRKVLINILIVHCCVLQMKYLSDDVTKRHDCRVTGCLNDGRCQKVEEVRVNEDGEKEVRRTWMKCSCPLSWMGPHCEEGYHFLSFLKRSLEFHVFGLQFCS